MSPELIGIIAAAVSLGTLMLATTHSIRRELSELRANDEGLRKDIKASGDQLRKEISASGDQLRKEIRASGDRSHAEATTSKQELREEIGALREEIQAGFKELHARISNLADRVSKVEGIIEGLFWGTRNQPPEKSREGVA